MSVPSDTSKDLSPHGFVRLPRPSETLRFKLTIVGIQVKSIFVRNSRSQGSKILPKSSRTSLRILALESSRLRTSFHEHAYRIKELHVRPALLDPGMLCCSRSEPVSLRLHVHGASLESGRVESKARRSSLSPFLIADKTPDHSLI